MSEKRLLGLKKFGRFWVSLQKQEKVSFFVSFESDTVGTKITMRAEIVAYMIYLERSEYPEYVMHIFYLKYSGTQIWEYVK